MDRQTARKIKNEAGAKIRAILAEKIPLEERDNKIQSIVKQVRQKTTPPMSNEMKARIAELSQNQLSQNQSCCVIQTEQMSAVKDAIALSPITDENQPCYIAQEQQIPNAEPRSAKDAIIVPTWTFPEKEEERQRITLDMYQNKLNADTSMTKRRKQQLLAAYKDDLETGDLILIRFQ